jgi:holo-[acyl-carrier protein] synthase
MGVRVGLDLVSIADIEDSIRVHSGRYLARVYTTAELADCRLPGGAYNVRSLAACIAAKEAVLKVLGVEDEGIPWRAIGVRKDRSGCPSIELTGAAEVLAQQRGVESLDVTLAHSGPFAAAVVVAEVRGER